MSVHVSLFHATIIASYYNVTMLKGKSETQFVIRSALDTTILPQIKRRHALDIISYCIIQTGFIIMRYDALASNLLVLHGTNGSRCILYR